MSDPKTLLASSIFREARSSEKKPLGELQPKEGPPLARYTITVENCVGAFRFRAPELPQKPTVVVKGSGKTGSMLVMPTAKLDDWKVGTEVDDAAVAGLVTAGYEMLQDR